MNKWRKQRLSVMAKQWRNGKQLKQQQCHVKAISQCGVSKITQNG